MLDLKNLNDEKFFSGLEDIFEEELYGEFKFGKGCIEYQCTPDDSFDTGFYWIDTGEVTDVKRFSLLFEGNCLADQVSAMEKPKEKVIYLASHFPIESFDPLSWNYFEIKDHDLMSIGKTAEQIVKHEKENTGAFNSKPLLDFLKKLPTSITWRDALTKMLVTEEGNSGKSNLHTSDHICELHLHYEKFYDDDLFGQLIVYDNLWARKNADIHVGIQSMANTWLLK